MIHITYPAPSLRAAYAEKNHRPSVLFANMFRGNLSTPGSGAAGFPHINTTDGKTNTGWIGVAGAPVSLHTVNDLPAQPVDCLCIAAHTLGTQNATIRARGYIGGAWVNLSDAVTVSDDSTIMLIFPEATVTGIDLRIEAFDAQPFIGVLAAGKRLVMKPKAALPFKPIHLSEEIDMLVNTSGNGNFLGSRVKRKGLRGEINLTLTDYDWVLRNLDPFRRHYNDGGSFFFAPCPGIFRQDINYCWRDGDAMVPEFVIPAGQDTLVQLRMEVRGYAG